MYHSIGNKIEKKPVKMIERAQNHVVLCWENIFENGTRYKIQILNSLKKWDTIYWGTKDQCKVDKLVPCTCYNFRIKSDKDEEEQWIYFKAATEEGPFYCTSHMTRYINLGRTSFVRRIAHIRPYLLNTENKQNKTPLVQSIDLDDIQMTHVLISLGANVNKPLCFNQRTPLMIAVYQGKLHIARLLLDKGANKFAQDVNGLNILHYGVDSDNFETVKFCVDLLKDVNYKDNKGWTPLIRAGILGASKEIIDLLLENGADKLIEDKSGFNYDTHCKMTQTLVI